MRSVGVKLELRIPKAVSDLVNDLVGTIYGQNRAEVARFLLQMATIDHATSLQAERDAHAKRLAGQA